MQKLFGEGFLKYPHGDSQTSLTYTPTNPFDC